MKNKKQVKKPQIIKKNSIIIFSKGEYEDYSYCIMYVCKILKDIDINEYKKMFTEKMKHIFKDKNRLAEFIKKNKTLIKEWNFIQFLKENNVIQILKHKEITLKF